jgi:hypothetical protein
LGQAALFVPMPAALAALTAAPSHRPEDRPHPLLSARRLPESVQPPRRLFPGFSGASQEFVAAGPTYQIRPASIFLRLQQTSSNTVADRMTKRSLIDLNDRDRSGTLLARIADITLGAATFCRNDRRLAMPVTGSTMAAVR